MIIVLFFLLLILLLTYTNYDGFTCQDVKQYIKNYTMIRCLEEEGRIDSDWKKCEELVIKGYQNNDKKTSNWSGWGLLINDNGKKIKLPKKDRGCKNCKIRPLTTYSLESGLKSGGDHIYGPLGFEKPICNSKGQSTISEELEKKIDRYINEIHANNEIFLDIVDIPTKVAGEIFTERDKYLLNDAKWIPNLIHKIKEWEEEWNKNCIENYCQTHTNCKGTNDCTRKLCKKICKKWVKLNKHKPKSPYLGPNLNEFLKIELSDVKTSQDAKIRNAQRQKRDAIQKKLAFCIDWKDKTSSDPYSDPTVQSDIRQVGSIWRGIKKAPTKLDCLALEMEAVLGKKEENVEEEEVAFGGTSVAGADVDLDELQGVVKEGPTGTTVNLEIQNAKAMFLDSPYMITDYAN